MEAYQLAVPQNNFMIVICTPTRDNVTGGFAFDLVNLVRHYPDTVFAVSQGSILSNLRQGLAEASIKNGASHILFIDSDMRFPANTIGRLWEKNVDIIGANCSQRTQNQFTARKGGEFISSENKTGIEEVDTIGFGVTLIRTNVFQNLPKPWFSMPWDGEKHIGEDVFFCDLARFHGAKIYVDHDLSKEIKHTGTMEFGL